MAQDGGRWCLALSVVVVLLSAVQQGAAQSSGTIRGVVYDADFDTPLANALVRVAETDDRTKTTEQGNYAITGVAPGSYTLVVNKEGYEREVLAEVVVRAGRLTEVDARLSGSFVTMNEFVVQELQFAAGSAEAMLDVRFEAGSILDGLGAQELSSFGLSDAGEALSAIPGATTTDQGFAAVRGLPPRFVSTQLNGFVLPSANPDTRAVKLDLFPADVIESIQVSKTFTPDQQGTASGGAVNIVTKSIPARNFLEISSKVEMNTQRAGDGEFLVDGRGDAPRFSFGPDRQLGAAMQGLGFPTQATLFEPDAFGKGAPDFGDSPTEYDWSVTGGWRHEFDGGLRLGGLFTYFWEQDASHVDDAVNEQRVLLVDNPEFGMLPTIGGAGQFNQAVRDDPAEQVTNIFDETESSHEVTWGGLATFGIETENHQVDLSVLHTRLITSTATIAEDTRAKLEKFPGHDPSAAATPGGAEHTGPAVGRFGETLEVGGDLRRFAPFRRLETQENIERTAQSVQARGEHTLPWPAEGLSVADLASIEAPVFRWSTAASTSKREEPGFTSVDTKFTPPGTPGGTGAQGKVFPPNSNALGFYNVVFRDIEEDSTQFKLSGELPFEMWDDEQGFVKLGLYDERTTRELRKDSFRVPNGNPSGVSGAVPLFLSVQGGFDEARFSDAFFSDAAGEADDPFTFPLADRGKLVPNANDLSYDGEQNVEAWYWMADIPVAPFLHVIGGVRFEDTQQKTRIFSDQPNPTILLDIVAGRELPDLPNAFGPDFPGGSIAFSTLEQVGVTSDVDTSREDVLPALAFVLTPIEGLDIRGAYSETIARPTFRELTPVTQTFFTGETPFIGNPFLEFSEVENYDLRVDYRPMDGSLISLSYFQKDVRRPIQVIQQEQRGSNLVVPVNFPAASVEGWEIEVRQDMGRLFEPLEGLTIGGNATFLDTEVTLREFEAEQFAEAGISVGDVPMVNAPDLLYSMFASYGYDWDDEGTRTELSVFYTVRGDTLIASPGLGAFSGSPATAQVFIPGVYETQFGTLNLTLKQTIGKHLQLSFSAKNLTDPERQTVYRSDALPDGDVVKTSAKEGVDLSFGVSLEFEF